MGYLTERLNQLWAYKTTFGSLNYNIICISCNVSQILVTCILLGTFHKHLTIEYIWWPVFEGFRVLVLTLSRFDVLLKDINDYRNNRASFIQTRRIIMFCNLLGIASYGFGWILYMALLPNDYKLYYTLYCIFFVLFFVMRIALTTPMIYVLLCNTAFYDHDYLPLGDPQALNNELAIDDPLQTNDNKKSENNENDTNNEENTQINGNDNKNNTNNVINDGLRDNLLWNAIEERQLQIAMEASQNDLLRSVRVEQDLEFEKEEQRQKELNKTLQSETAIKENMSKSTQNIETLDYAKTPTNDEDLNNNNNDEIYGKHISTSDLDDLPDEEPESNESVLVRARLPNGSRPQRRFHYSNSISDVKLWINHELVKNNLHEYVFNFLLVSNMPRTVYGDDHISNDDNLQKIGWHNQSMKRQGQSPLLFIELEDQNS